MTAIWDRVYRLEVGGDDELLVVDGFKDEPAQIQFNVSMHADSMLAFAVINIYGLGRSTREQVYERYTDVRLIAGYRENHGQLFAGTIYNVGIGRDGPESIVTLFCRSTGRDWASAFVMRTWGAGTPAKEIIEYVAGTFGFPVKLIGDFDDLPAAISGLTISDDSKSVMRGFARNYSLSWGVENGQMIVSRLGASREAADSFYRLSADSGMVGSPRINERGIDVTSKLNPSIRPHDQVEVENATGDLTFNNPSAARFPDTIGRGIYQVRGVGHVGDYYGDAWDTLIEGWRPRIGQLPRTGN